MSQHLGEVPEREGLRPLNLVASDAHVSYRQAHYWQGRGWIRAEFYTRKEGALVEAGGSGRDAYVSMHEAKVLRIMGQLVGLGLSPSKAAGPARALADGLCTIRVADGIWLTTRRPG